MYRNLGDSDALQEIRSKNREHSHCPFLRQDPLACEALPVHEGVAADKVGKACPNNVYASHPQVFANRDGVADNVERLFRLVNSAELGVLSQSSLDPLSVTELITARGELDRQQHERTKREYERAKLEAQSNQSKALPNWDKK